MVFGFCFFFVFFFCCCCWFFSAFYFPVFLLFSILNSFLIIVVFRYSVLKIVCHNITHSPMKQDRPSRALPRRRSNLRNRRSRSSGYRSDGVNHFRSEERRRRSRYGSDYDLDDDDDDEDEEEEGEEEEDELEGSRRRGRSDRRRGKHIQRY